MVIRVGYLGWWFLGFAEVLLIDMISKCLVPGKGLVAKVAWYFLFDVAGSVLLIVLECT